MFSFNQLTYRIEQYFGISKKFDFENKHSFEDIKNAYNEDKRSINSNPSILMDLVLQNHDIEAFKFLLECKEFKLEYTVKRIILSIVYLHQLAIERCKTCKYTESNLIDNIEQNKKINFDFHFKVFCLCSKNERIMLIPEFIVNALYVFPSWTKYITHIFMSRIQSRHIENLLNSSQAVHFQRLEMYKTWRFFQSPFKKKHFDFMHYDDNLYKIPFKQLSFIDEPYYRNIGIYAESRLLPIICSIRLTEVAMTLGAINCNLTPCSVISSEGLSGTRSQVKFGTSQQDPYIREKQSSLSNGVPIYIILKVAEELPFFNLCKDTFTEKRRIRLIQNVVDFIKRMRIEKYNRITFSKKSLI